MRCSAIRRLYGLLSDTCSNVAFQRRRKATAFQRASVTATGRNTRGTCVCCARAAHLGAHFVDACASTGRGHRGQPTAAPPVWLMRGQLPPVVLNESGGQLLWHCRTSERTLGRRRSTTSGPGRQTIQARRGTCSVVCKHVRCVWRARYVPPTRATAEACSARIWAENFSRPAYLRAPAPASLPRSSSRPLTWSM